MKKIINWNYERASWQWDLLCVLIMAFIFLTPKVWFNKAAALAATQTAVSAVETGNGGRRLLPQGR
ncbi:MAG: hypothetical protein IPM59_14255 [Chloracidobacterium sp.]|nr:hypothetical protein [Chloracidobacterium sp.]